MSKTAAEIRRARATINGAIARVGADQIKDRVGPDGVIDLRGAWRPVPTLEYGLSPAMQAPAEQVTSNASLQARLIRLDRLIRPPLIWMPKSSEQIAREQQEMALLAAEQTARRRAKNRRRALSRSRARKLRKSAGSQELAPLAVASSPAADLASAVPERGADWIAALQRPYLPPI
jgi:hypothetical protein